MYYLLALITKGSVRTLVQCVEESNGAEAWASDTQQICARHTESSTCLIMMIAKPWCGRADGFESGLRAWELFDHDPMRSGDHSPSSTRRQAGAECLLLDSVAQLHA